MVDMQVWVNGVQVALTLTSIIFSWPDLSTVSHENFPNDRFTPESRFNERVSSACTIKPIDRAS